MMSSRRREPLFNTIWAVIFLSSLTLSLLNTSSTPSREMSSSLEALPVRLMLQYISERPKDSALMFLARTNPEYWSSLKKERIMSPLPSLLSRAMVKAREARSKSALPLRRVSSSSLISMSFTLKDPFSPSIFMPTEGEDGMNHR